MRINHKRIALRTMNNFLEELKRGLRDATSTLLTIKSMDAAGLTEAEIQSHLTEVAAATGESLPPASLFTAKARKIPAMIYDPAMSLQRPDWNSILASR